MKSLLFALVAGLIIVSCQVPVEKQYFSESADIDLGIKLMNAYLAQDWDAYPEFYADTAKVWRNKNWSKDEGFTVQQYIDDLKSQLETISSYKFDPQNWESVITNDGEHWVHFWGVWIGHSDSTNKDYEIPVHFALQVVDKKIVRHGEFFNSVELTLDMMALAQESAGEEDNQ
jgi:hypothetical protein